MVSKFDVVLVNLDPSVGKEYQKIRPCVVVSPTDLNNKLGTVQIAPLMSAKRGWVFRPVVQNKVESEVAIDQIRAINKTRIIRNLGHLSAEDAEKVQVVLEAFYAR